MQSTPEDDLDASAAVEQAKLELVVAEYNWVSGLIRYYREVELKALGGTGLLLSAAVAGFTALRAAEKDTQHEQALLLSTAAWVPAVSLLIVLMASLRGFRAVVYVRDRLHPLAVRLAGGDEEVLAWEQDSQRLAFETSVLGRSSVGRVVQWLITGLPVILLITMASLFLAIAGLVLWPSLTTAAIGVPAAALALALAVMGAAFTRLSHAFRGRGGDPGAASAEAADVAH